MSDLIEMKKVVNHYEPMGFDHLLGTPGFSDKLLRNHFKLYEGYVKNTNELIDFFEVTKVAGQSKSPKFSESKRRFGWEFNGMRLHEYYFGNMQNKTASADPASGLLKKISKDFGSYENWRSEFEAVGMMRGIGWSILVHDRIGDRLFNIWINEHDLGFLAGAEPILVMDVFEHAYLSDYGLERNEYVSSFMKVIHWTEVQKRFGVR